MIKERLEHRERIRLLGTLFASHYSNSDHGAGSTEFDYWESASPHPCICGLVRFRYGSVVFVHASTMLVLFRDLVSCYNDDGSPPGTQGSLLQETPLRECTFSGMLLRNYTNYVIIRNILSKRFWLIHICFFFSKWHSLQEYFLLPIFSFSVADTYRCTCICYDYKRAWYNLSNIYAFFGRISRIYMNI